MKTKISTIRRWLACMLCAVMVTVSLSGCENMGNIVSGVTAAGEFPVEINGVTISAKPAKAIVLSPSLADVILALGCETQLLAGSDDCTQDSLRDLQKISGDDAQAVIGLAPDMVISDSFDEGMSSALSDAGITMLTVSPATDREDFERLYSQVAAAFSGGGAGYDAGIARAQEIFTVLDDINRIVPKETVTTACYLYDLDGAAVTGDMFASTLMSCAGVTNAFSSDKGGTYQFQSLRVSNPNVIFCVPGLKEQMKANADFAKLRAVKENKVFELDPSLMEWQGRTVIDAAYEISASAFPELLEEKSSAVSLPGEESSSSSELSSKEESDTTSYTELTEGDSNDEVYKLQERLEELGYLDTEYDGHFGEYTAGCVKEFQKANGLEETGIADAETQRALFSKKAKAKGNASSSSNASNSSGASSSSEVSASSEGPETP